MQERGAILLVRTVFKPKQIINRLGEAEILLRESNLTSTTVPSNASTRGARAAETQAILHGQTKTTSKSRFRGSSTLPRTAFGAGTGAMSRTLELTSARRS